MSTYTVCPGCGKALHIPQGCGGMVTKCPSCHADFMIPGPTPVAQPAVVCAVAMPAVPMVTPAEVLRAKLEAERLAADDLALAIHLNEVKRGHDRQVQRLAILMAFQSGRVALDHSLGRVGGFFVTITLAPAVLVLVASLFSPAPVVYGLIIAISIGLAGLAYLPFSAVPDDARLTQLIQNITPRVQQSRALCDQLCVEESTLGQKHAAAEKEYQRLQAAFEKQPR